MVSPCNSILTTEAAMEIYGKMVFISLTLWLQYSFLISLWSQWLASNYADHIKNQKRRSLSHFKTPTWLRWNHSPWGFIAVWPVAQSSLNIFVKGALYGCPNVFVIYTQSDGYSSNNKVSLCASSAYELIQIWLSAKKPHPPVTLTFRLWGAANERNGGCTTVQYKNKSGLFSPVNHAKLPQWYSIEVIWTKKCALTSYLTAHILS